MKVRSYFTIVCLLIGIIIIVGCVPQISPKESEELKVKTYLVKKYDPGRCFGMPGPVPEEIITETLKKNPYLVSFVKKEFEDSIDKKRIYYKIDKLQHIDLIRTDNGYDFTFKNGKCCSIETYKGKIVLSDNQIMDEVTNITYQGEDC